MAQKPPEDTNTDLQVPNLVTPSAGSGRPMLLLGVVGACALGVGAGLWARPHEDERRAVPVAAKVAEAPKPSRTLKIVVQDAPAAPIGAPIEVLPARTGYSAPAAAYVPESTPLAPLRPPTGLVRVQAVEPIQVEPAPIAAPPVVKPEPKRVEKAAPKVAKAEPKPAKAKAPERKIAKAEVEKSKAKERKAEKPVKLAKSEPKKAEAAEPKKSRKLTAALAKVTPKPVKQAASASKAKLADARKARAEKEKAKVELAKLEASKVRKAEAKRAKAEKAKVEKAALRKPAAPAKAAAKPAVVPKPTRDNPIRKASNRCVSSDAGAALVCADPSLGAADRQLARAYRQAEAAGVSTATLARQQARWLTARAQAAREAPWAVRDVYEARIAELNDMTRDAREF